MDGNGQDSELIVERAAVPTPLEVQLDSQKAIARIGAIAQVIDGCAKASIQRTNAADWVKMGKGYYLQASGAQKIRPIWGIYFRDRRVIKEMNPDGTYSYLATCVVGSKVLDQLYGEVTIEIDGGRSSNDPFFVKGNREPDPLDVRKAALANLESRAVTALLGLKNLNAEDLARNGVKVEAIIGVDYAKGAEGGGNTAVISEAQAKRLYAIASGARVANETVKDLLSRYGWTSSSQITREKYEEVVLVVQGGPAAVARQIVKLAGLKAEATREPGEDG